MKKKKIIIVISYDYEDKNTVSNDRIADRKAQAAAAATQAALQAEAALTVTDLLRQLGTSPDGLSEAEAAQSRETNGENQVTREKKKSIGRRLTEAFVNPFTIILVFLAAVSVVTDIIIPIMQHNMDDYNPATVIIISVLVILSGTLRFVQETRSGDAAAKLLELITTTCTVIRNRSEGPLRQPGLPDR